jgi:glutathione synthase/RimK-type ligase-like ATP-grasp enzyme
MIRCIDNNVVIVPYRKSACPSAANLADALGVRCHSAQYILNKMPARLYINWGSTGYELRQVNAEVVNKPQLVYGASDKIVTFRKLHDACVRVPWFTTNISEAHRYMQEHGSLIARTETRGSRGSGVVFLERLHDIIDAPLYVQYINKEKEFRVHVFKGKAIDIVQKKRANGTEKPVIWNVQAGFSFSHNVRWGAIENLARLGEKAVNALELDFGAVDIMWGNGHLYVLEVNTAPGINIEETIDKYAKTISGLINEQ